tara:strand:- start:56 stop:838 length:783 start_codon:yes stop_codon:yes gene_type:complete
MKFDTEKIISLAEEAGLVILNIYKEDFSIYKKDDESPITAADRLSHEIIISKLKKYFPAIPILSEESKKIPFSHRKKWKIYWLIDPLDGTKEFIKRNGEFTVNIALIENGVPIFGVVHQPTEKITYFGGKICPAQKRSNSGTQTIKANLISSNPIRIVASKSHGSGLLDTFIEKTKNYTLLKIGSSLKICLIAEGAADIYPRFGPTSEWDTAAAHAIAKAAGAKITNFQLEDLKYNTKDSLLNPSFIAFADVTKNWLDFL